MEPILRAEKLTKRFGELTANREIDIEIHAGEIHAIAGENGAGKSTLMKMLYGVYQPTAGNLYIDGEKMERWNPTIAREKGIGMVFQDFRLVPAFTVLENVFLSSILPGGRSIKRSFAMKLIESQRNTIFPWILTRRFGSLTSDSGSMWRS